MKFTRTIKLATILLLFSMIGTSCVSSYVNKESAKTVAMRKALITNNEPVMKALRNGEDVSNTGISVSVLEAAKERPLLQLFALLADGGIGVAGYKGVKAIDDSSSNNDVPANSATNGDNISVNGDSNVINITKSPAETSTQP